MGSGTTIGAAPVRAADRIAALDVLRGFALFGVFMVNLSYVSGPFMGVAGPDAPVSERVAQAVLKGVFETKFVTLFSLLFGMGLVLQLERARAKGVEMGAIYRRRLGILFCMGILHGVLLFEGDILFLYSLAGFVLFLCHRWSARKLALASLIPFAIGVVLTSIWALIDEGGFATGGAYDEELRRSVTEGPLLLTLKMRALTFALLQLLFTIMSFNWRVLALFFLGAALMKTGILGVERKALRARVAVLGITVGATLEGLGALVDASGAAPGVTAWAGALAHEFGSLVLAFGFGAAVVWSVHAGRCPRVASALACVGRTALTNYLGQSVLMNVTLYWFGFALYDKWSPWGYMALVCVLFAGQVAISAWWIRRFAIGPAEWAWRALTYGRRPAWR